MRALRDMVIVVCDLTRTTSLDQAAEKMRHFLEKGVLSFAPGWQVTLQAFLETWADGKEESHD